MGKTRQRNESKVGEPKKKDQKVIKKQATREVEIVQVRGNQGQGAVKQAKRASPTIFALMECPHKGPNSAATIVYSIAQRKRPGETHSVTESQCSPIKQRTLRGGRGKRGKHRPTYKYKHTQAPRSRSVTTAKRRGRPHGGAKVPAPKIQELSKKATCTRIAQRRLAASCDGSP